MLPLRNKRNALEYAQKLVQSALEALFEAEFRQFMVWEKAAGRKPARNGYNTRTVSGRYGEVTIRIPRDRKGHFSPRLLPKWKRKLNYLDTHICQIYAIFVSSDSSYTGERYARLMREISHLYVGTLSREELCAIARCLRTVSFEHRAVLENVQYGQVFSLDSMNYVDNTRWYGGYSLDYDDRYHFRPYPRPVPKYTSNWGQGLATIVADCDFQAKRPAKRVRRRRDRMAPEKLTRKRRIPAPVPGGVGEPARGLAFISVRPGLVLEPYPTGGPDRYPQPGGKVRKSNFVHRNPVSRQGYSRAKRVEFWMSHAGFGAISTLVLAAPPGVSYKPGRAAA